MNPFQTAISPPIALTIAGFDPSNGAGITADLQVFAAHGLFGTSAITALTAQSTLGVAGVSAVDSTFLGKTLDHLTADLPPAGVKIGMLGTSKIAGRVAEFLQVQQKGIDGNSLIPIVLDPVLVSSSGAPLLDTAGIEVLHTRLLPTVTWITPNWSELAILAQQEVRTASDAEAALATLGQHYPHLTIVATGGDISTPTDILRIPTGELRHFIGTHIDTTSTHGTGCAFSSALLSRLILGDGPIQALAAAKAYVEGALRHAPRLGHGRGPMSLLWNR